MRAVWPSPSSRANHIPASPVSKWHRARLAYSVTGALTTMQPCTTGQQAVRQKALVKITRHPPQGNVAGGSPEPRLTAVAPARCQRGRAPPPSWPMRSRSSGPRSCRETWAGLQTIGVRQIIKRRADVMMRRCASLCILSQQVPNCNSHRLHRQPRPSTFGAQTTKVSSRPRAKLSGWLSSDSSPLSPLVPNSTAKTPQSVAAPLVRKSSNEVATQFTY
jgi:hypothetical protein